MSKLLAFSMLLGFGLVLGCSSTTEPFGTEEFTVYADSISAPDSIPWFQSFGIRVWATLGPNACHKFSRFELKWDYSESSGNFELHVNMVGERTSGCAFGPRNWSRILGKQLVIEPPYPGENFVLVLAARGGADLRHAIARAPQNPERVADTGKVVYNDFEGGFFGIVDDHHRAWVPLYFPSELEVDGTRVAFEGIVREDLGGPYMWGLYLQVTSARRLD